MKDESEALLKGRLRLIKSVVPNQQVDVPFVDSCSLWRPLKKVEEWPLAFCDGRTVKEDDLVASDNIRSRYVGENLFARYHTVPSTNGTTWQIKRRTR